MRSRTGLGMSRTGLGRSQGRSRDGAKAGLGMEPGPGLGYLYRPGLGYLYRPGLGYLYRPVLGVRYHGSHGAMSGHASTLGTWHN